MLNDLRGHEPNSSYKVEILLHLIKENRTGVSDSWSKKGHSMILETSIHSEGIQLKVKWPRLTKRIYGSVRMISPRNGSNNARDPGSHKIPCN